ncbi:MAG TPA: hypothetical protein PK879_04520 [Opitutaceae bacterium]|nr:hypothetical protein [Opitutaceae bacterium]HPN99956.1 hypothetical protein [Opitutaceae bacterium]
MKLFLRALVFLAATFVVVYIGMTNTATIPFRFPILFDHDIKQPAAIIYFGVFAIGVIAGLMVLGGGSGGGKSAPKSSSDGKKK